jgi:hypothetical protein
MLGFFEQTRLEAFTGERHLANGTQIWQILKKY